MKHPYPYPLRLTFKVFPSLPWLSQKEDEEGRASVYKSERVNIIELDFFEHPLFPSKALPLWHCSKYQFKWEDWAIAIKNSTIPKLLYRTDKENIGNFSWHFLPHLLHFNQVNIIHHHFQTVTAQGTIRVTLLLPS